jgi:hypothetical protein
MNELAPPIWPDLAANLSVKPAGQICGGKATEMKGKCQQDGKSGSE